MPMTFSLHKNDLVIRDGLIYIPDNEIKLRILKMCHDSRTSGHLGQAKTLENCWIDNKWECLE